MKRSEYKKLLLEFLQLNEASDLLEPYKGKSWVNNTEDNSWNYLTVRSDASAIEFFDSNGKYKFSVLESEPTKIKEWIDGFLIKVSPSKNIINKSKPAGPSQSGKEKIREIQRIIDPEAKHTKPDGDWKSGTNTAWYEYIRVNHEIINQMIKDYEDSEKENIEESRLMMLFEEEEAADYLSGEEADGDPKMNAAKLAKKTGNAGNIAGVLAFTQAVEGKRTAAAEEGSESAAASIDQNNDAFPEIFRDKFWQVANQDPPDSDIYYVSDDGLRLYINATKEEIKDSISGTAEAYNDFKTPQTDDWNDLKDYITSFIRSVKK